MRVLRWWPLGLALAVTGSQAQWTQTCARRAAEVQPQVVAAAPLAVAPLQRRSDLRSQALADYLLAAAGTAEADAARARLQDRARSSTDPMLTVLALHMPCVRPGCRNIEASQWSRLEPDNLFAWLALPARSGADGRYLLNEIGAHVRHARSYQQEAAALLADLPPSGLDLRQPWGLLNLRAVAGSCRNPADVGMAERCQQAANLLWADGGAVESLFALLLADQTLALLPQQRPVWQPRLDELLALLRDRGFQKSAGVAPTRQRICEALALTRGGERAAVSEAERMRMVEQISGLSTGDVLYRRWAERMRPAR